MANCDSTDGFPRCVACSCSVPGYVVATAVFVSCLSGQQEAHPPRERSRLPVTRPRTVTRPRIPRARSRRLPQKKRPTTHPPAFHYIHHPATTSWPCPTVPRATQRSTQPTPRHRVPFSVVDAPFFGSLLRRPTSLLIQTQFTGSPGAMGALSALAYAEKKEELRSCHTLCTF